MITVNFLYSLPCGPVKGKSRLARGVDQPTLRSMAPTRLNEMGFFADIIEKQRVHEIAETWEGQGRGGYA